MDYYQQEKRTWPSWLIWSLAVICILFVIAIVYGIILYKDIQQSKTAGMDATKKLVLHDTNVVHIDNIFLFHGDTRYHVVEGKTKDGKEAYVFVPKNKKNNKLTVVSETNIIAKDNMLQQWQNSCNQCQLIKITPALLEKQPLWEITYRDSTDRYVIDYFNMAKGSRYEQFSFKSLFK